MNSVQVKTSVVKVTMKNAPPEVKELSTVDKILIMHVIGRAAKLRGYKVDTFGKKDLRGEYRRLFVKLKPILDKM